MRNKFTRKLAASLAVLLSVNCMTPALAGIDTIKDDYIYDEDEWGVHSPGNSKHSPGNWGATFSNWKSARMVTLTNITQLDSFFDDAKFQEAVWKAIEGENLEGATVEEALGNFSGTINAKGKGIVKITGIHLLHSATEIDLRNNKITDWTPLKAPGPMGSQASKTYYGGIDEDSAYYNTEIKLAKNPFERIPSMPDSTTNPGDKGRGMGFGGKLVIAQPGTQSWTYDVQDTFTFVRDGTETFDSTINIGRCVRVDDSGQETPVHIISAAPNFGKEFPSALLSVKSFNDTSAQLSNIVRSGLQRIGIGVDQELHYQTTDEYGTITPGSQSFKYYLQARIHVYDKIKVTSGPYTGGFVLTKVDDGDSTKKLPGAEYELAKDGASVGTYTTDGQGKISLVGLEPGSYTLTETKAPEGYQLNSPNTPVSFQIVPHETTISGGLTEVKNIDGNTLATVADDRKERYIAGPSSYPNSGYDIVLTRASNIGKADVTVTYNSLGGTPSVPGIKVTQVFSSVKDAQDDINKQKNANKITGLVEVDVKYVDTVADAEKVTVTNVPTPDIPVEVTTKISGHKQWIDETNYHGLHPTIRIILHRNGTEIDSIKLFDGQEDYEFHNLKINDSNGRPYRYTVSEEFVDPGEKPKFLSKQDGYDFTNIYIGGVMKIQGHKGWDDAEYYEEWNRNNPESLLNAPDPEHPEVTIELDRDGTFFQSFVIESGKDSFVFHNLPQRNPRTGKDYIYTVKEANPKHYKPSANNGYDFLNTYEPNYPETPPSSPNGGGGGGGNPPDTPYTPGGPGDQPLGPGPGEQVPPVDPFSPEGPGGPEDPGNPGEPGALSSLPKTGQKRSMAIWILLSSLGLAVGATLITVKKFTHQDS